MSYFISETFYTNPIVTIKHKSRAEMQNIKKRNNLILSGAKPGLQLRKTAPQIALRDCFKEAIEEGQYIRVW